MCSDGVRDNLSGVATKETEVNVNLTLFLVGLPFGNRPSVASALEGSSSNAATAGAQSSPSWVMVTGLDRLRVPSKPSSHDWCPEMTSGTMDELVQVCNHCSLCYFFFYLRVVQSSKD